MTKRNLISLNQYDKLVSQISKTYLEGKRKTVMAVSWSHLTIFSYFCFPNNSII